MLTPPCWRTDGGWTQYTPGTQYTPPRPPPWIQIISFYSYTRTHYGHLNFEDNKDICDFISSFRELGNNICTSRITSGLGAEPLCNYSKGIVDIENKRPAPAQVNIQGHRKNIGV